MKYLVTLVLLTSLAFSQQAKPQENAKVEAPASTTTTTPTDTAAAIKQMEVLGEKLRHLKGFTLGITSITR